jgi:hypothetical protein
MLKILRPIATTIVLAGCATITRGATEQIQVISEPPDAEAKTSLGHECRTPCTLTVARKDEFNISVVKEGYERQQVPVIVEVAGAGGAAFAGNILLGGFVGMGADAATGAAYSHAPNPVSVVLRPEPPAEPKKVASRAARRR